MLRLKLIVVLAFLFALPGEAFAQTPENSPRVDSPLPGVALQGTVVISGNTDLPGFAAVEISFSYAGAPGSWFLIVQGRKAVKDGTLAVWDTSTIADGSYSLKVLVTFQDGTEAQVVVPDLRVRNYTPIETSTPSRAQANLPTLVITLTPIVPTGTPGPTPTPLPANPAEIQTPGLIYNGLLGLGFVVILFGLLGIYRASSKKNSE